MSAKDRAAVLEWLRGEIVGPTRVVAEEGATCAAIADGHLTMPQMERPSPLFHPIGTGHEEVLYFSNETPHRKYGAGLLHPRVLPSADEGGKPEGATDNLGLD